jgi:hypothetical protein
MSSIEHGNVAAGTTGAAVAPDAWIRKTRRTGTFAALAYLNAAGWVAIAIDVLTKPEHTRETGTVVVTLVFLLGVAALSVLFGRRLAKCGVWMSREKVVVCGPLKTWTLDVGEVKGFEPGLLGAGNGTPCPVLRRTHGRPIGIWALGRDALIANNRRSLEELQPLCKQLGELLAEMKAAT